ncbi:MAG: hypothetical protein PHE84_08180 [bacterium]|nr:hypothetical protein [bacterium]
MERQEILNWEGITTSLTSSNDKTQMTNEYQNPNVKTANNLINRKPFNLFHRVGVSAGVGFIETLSFGP